MNLNTKKEENDFTDERRVCACCGKSVVDSFEVCNICGWENDSVQNDDPDYAGGANHMSLNEAKQAFKEGRKIY